MSTYRAIETVIRDVPPYWVGNGFYVRQYFPTKRITNFFRRFSPFLVMDYGAPTHFKGTDRRAGIGPHPHRGIATVTFAFEGSIEHGDNQGNRGVIHPGDIQWMTAGDGILHKEFHETEYAKNDRILHMIQLWVDLPTAHKRTQPTYQAITADQMGKRTLEGGGELIVYAGEVFQTKGPAETFSPMNIYKINLQAGQSVILSEPDGYNTGALVVRGAAKVNEEASAQASDFLLFANDGRSIRFEGAGDGAEIVILSGQPLDQPVVAHGPFVMNTQQEILEANRDYQEGRFGSHDF